MKIYYDKDTDYAEVFFRSTPNYAVEINEQVVQFLSEDDDSMVGYGFERASKSVKESEFVSDQVKDEFKRFLEKGGRNG